MLAMFRTVLAPVVLALGIGSALFLTHQSLWLDEATQMSGLALDPVGVARQTSNESGAEPQTPRNHGPHQLPTSQATTRTSKTLNPPLDITRPFMDDTGGLQAAALVTSAEPAQLIRAPDCR